MKSYILAVAMVLLAAFPWLLGTSYSKGNDFFYWLHFARWLEPFLWQGRLPDWTMWSGCGQPAFNLDHLPDAIGLALLTSSFGLEGGMRAFIILCYVIGGTGTYLLAWRLIGHRQAALVATAAYLFSWYLTRTADFYVYTSNLLQLVLLPWVACCFRRAAEGGGWRAHSAAACLLTVCILANPQTAIKIAGFMSLWLLLEGALGSLRHCRLAGLARTLVLIGGVAAWLSAFHIATALIHRQEIHTFEERSGRPKDLASFLYLPAFAAGQLTGWLGLKLDLDLPLGKVIDSHYWGVSVFSLGAVALYRAKGRRRARVQVLWILTGIAVALFWSLSWFPPSEWSGAPRQILFIPAFCAALLCGYGALHASAWFRLRKWGRWWQAAPLLLVLVELGSLKVAFYLFGPHHLPLRQIPQLGFWQQVSAAQEWAPGERFYTFQSDLAFMLYPAFTGRPIANRIHQRDYQREYFTYQEALNLHLSQPPPYRPRISEYLGLLNIRYLDVSRDGYLGKFRPHYAQVLEHLDADPGLREIARRYPGPADQEWNRYATWSQHEPESGQGLPVQVIFANQRARFAFVPEQTIAILGEDGQQRFEEISLSPAFKFDRVLYLLCEDPRELAGIEPAIAGTIGPEAGPELEEGRLKRVGPAELDALYAAEVLPDRPQPRLESWQEERVVLALPPSDQERFAGIALQRFKDWHAYDGQGRELRAFKAGAGMTAIHLYPETDRIVLQYERPFYKTGWRLFSLAGFIACLGGMVWQTISKRRTNTPA